MTPEEKVQKLIALKRYEKPREGYFEDFLSEFQQRQREELLQRSSLSLFRERMGTTFKEFGLSKWLLGGGLAHAALTFAFILWQGKPASVEVPGGRMTPASYSGPSMDPLHPIQAVDFENGKRYRTYDKRRELRREF